MKQKLVLFVLPTIVFSNVGMLKPCYFKNEVPKALCSAFSSDEEDCYGDNEVNFFFESQYELHFLTTNESYNVLVDKVGVNLEIKRDGKQMTAVVKPQKEKSKMKIDFVFENKIVTKSYFFYSKDMDGFFGSEISMEEAEISYLKSLDSKISDFKPLEISNQKSIIIGPNLSFNCLTGKLKWKDDKGNVFPLRNVRVSIHSPAFVVFTNPYIDSKFGTTDENGSFSIPLNGYWQRVNGTDVTMEVKLSSSLASVYSENSKTAVHSFTKEITLNDLADENLNHTFSSNTMFGQAVQVFEAIDSYSKYAKNLCEKIEPVDVVYPATNVSGACYYSKNSGEFKEKTIYIKFENGAKDTKSDYVAPNSYASWDMIGHEYGHHIQNLYNLIVFNGGEHYVDGNNVLWNKAGYSGDDRLIKNNQLTWKESWPTYFAFCAQERFDSVFKNIEFVNDSDYSASNISYPICIVAHDDAFIAHGQHNIDGGEACEASVIRFLCHLENQTTSSFDRFSLGDKVIWEFINEYPIEEFYDFYNFMIEDDGYSREDVGLLLNKCRIGASIGYDVEHDLIFCGSLSGVKGLTEVWATFTLYDGNKNPLWTKRLDEGYFLNLFSYRSQILQANSNGKFYVGVKTTNYLNGIARTWYDSIVEYAYVMN